MRTTLELEKNLLDNVVRATGEKSQSKAVTRALEEYLYRKAVERLEELAGTIDVDDVWRELEELELAEARREQKQSRK